MSKQFQSNKTNRMGITQESNAGPSSSTSATATHFYASSIAILTKEILPKIESSLLELSSQSLPYLQREVVCRRLDDENEERKQIEQDNMYQPIRKARVQSRLRVRFENDQIDLRLYSKPSGKTLVDYVDVYNLICVPLECQQESNLYSNSNGIPREIDAGANVWQQIIQSMGWEPVHTIIKKGLKFIIFEDMNCTVQASIFQIFKVNSNKLDKVSDTHILHVSATLPFKSRLSSKSSDPPGGTNDAARLSERAQSEIAAVQERLKGLVRLSKEDE